MVQPSLKILGYTGSHHGLIIIKNIYSVDHVFINLPPIFGQVFLSKMRNRVVSNAHFLTKFAKLKIFDRSYNVCTVFSRSVLNFIIDLRRFLFCKKTGYFGVSSVRNVVKSHDFLALIKTV